MKFSYTTALVTLVGLAVAHETAVTETVVAPPTDSKDLAPEFKIIRTNDISCTIKSQRGDKLSVHYRGFLSNGTEFDSSYQRSYPVQLPMGEGKLIRGMEEGLLGMCVGEKRKLIVPSVMAYGEKGKGPVPSNEDLTFEAKLMGIVGKNTQLAGAANEAAKKAKEAAEAAGEKVADEAGEVKEKVEEKVEDVKEKVEETIEEAMESKDEL